MFVNFITCVGDIVIKTCVRGFHQICWGKKSDGCVRNIVMETRICDLHQLWW